MGFKLLLQEREESHLLITVLEPAEPSYNFNKMHDLLYERGFTIYPGKVGRVNTFRLANLGAINQEDINNFLKALRSVLDKMGDGGKTKRLVKVVGLSK